MCTCVECLGIVGVYMGGLWVCTCVECLGMWVSTCVECIGIVCGVPRDCGCVHVWSVGVYMCGVHRDCGCVDVWSA